MSLPVLALAAGAAYLAYKQFGSKSTRPSTPVNKVPSPTSGIQWEVQLVKTAGDLKFFDVFTTGGARILRYTQKGSDKNSRVEVVHPPGVDPALLAQARKDFLGK
jgi:hypothetical protein